jgi:hypothetical protein
MSDESDRHYLTWLINENFETDSVIGVFTYALELVPADEEVARRDLDNFVRRLAAVCKKRGLPAPKYIAFTYQIATTSRYHHHIILSCPLNLEEIEKLWSIRGKPLGGVIRPEFMPVGNPEPVVLYLLNHSHRCGRWKQSHNITRPGHKQGREKHENRL